MRRNRISDGSCKLAWKKNGAWIYLRLFDNFEQNIILSMRSNRRSNGSCKLAWKKIGAWSYLRLFDNFKRNFILLMRSNRRTVAFVCFHGKKLEHGVTVKPVVNFFLLQTFSASVNTVKRKKQQLQLSQ